MRILLVEDEAYLRDLIRLNLEMEDYEVVAATNGKDAVKVFHEQHFDLVVLDVMLPEINGFQVCEQIRLTNVKTPIIFLTAKDSSEDIIQGLKTGGDDYLTKPFVLEEFLLRIKNLLKRTSREQEMNLSIYRFGNNTVNFATYEATGDNGHFQLTKKEALLLKLLIDKKNQVVSRNEILQAVWGYDVYPSTRTIDNFILSFRKYFEKDPKNPLYFLSIRGVGYKFTEPEAA